VSVLLEFAKLGSTKCRSVGREVVKLLEATNAIHLTNVVCVLWVDTKDLKSLGVWDRLGQKATVAVNN